MSNTIFPANVRGLTYTVVKSQENSTQVKESPNFLTNRTQQNLNPRWHWTLQYEVLFDNILNPNPSNAYTDLQQLLGFCQSMYGGFDDFLYLDPDDNFVGPGVITATWLPRHTYILGSIVIASGHAQQVISAPAGAKSDYTIPTFSLSGGTVVDGTLTWQDLGTATNGGTNWPNPQAELQLVTDGTNYYSPIQRHLGGLYWEDITDLANGIVVYNNGVVASGYGLSTGSLAPSVLSSSGLYISWGTTAPATPVTATFNYYFRVRFEDSTQDFENFASKLWAIGGDQGSSGKGNLKFESQPRGRNAGVGPGGSPFPPFAAPSPCLASAQVLVLYPTQINLNQGTSPGITGFAAGVAGVNAWFMAQLLFQGLGSGGGVATLLNYPDPGIARSRICAVYSFIPFSHVPSPTQLGPNGAGFATSVVANGNAMIGGPIGNGFGTFLGPSPQTMVSLFQGPVNAANLNFSTISQACALGASLPGFYGDKMIGNASVIVYYS